jgi:aspartyl-tRNA(Asn)/glutamyl-tRNA(Gln) amidotransferase subunit B
MPGVLPVMNRQAYEYAVLTAMALDCRVATFTKWDRKSYYYPDLPKNYQISQYDLPLGESGSFEIPLESGRTKKIGIIRAHLEEDAGKNLHTTGNFSKVDLNRTGTPLLEIVTEPDMNSGAQVRALAVELQRMVRFLGVSEADMQKGHMRFEPNINLAITRDGTEYRTSIVEIKNLNSFRALERSVNYEERRQLEEFLETGKVMKTGSKTTRGWDDEREVTVLQREKEEAHDYRYFPDPDLEIRSDLCELPLRKQMRYVEQYKLSDYDAGVLTADRSTADFFERALDAGAEPKRLCNILTQTGLKMANEKGCGVGDLGVSALNVARLAAMVETDTVSAGSSATIFEAMIETGRDPEVLAQELNLVQKSDAGELEAVVEQVLAENPNAVEDVTAGGKKSKKARGFLLGQVMQRTKGQANPKVVSEILAGKLQ